MAKLIILRDAKEKIEKLKSNEVLDFYYGFHNLKYSKNFDVLYLNRSKPNSLIKFILFPFEKFFSKMTTLGFHLDIIFENYKFLKKFELVFTPTDGLSFAILFAKCLRIFDFKSVTLFQSLSERHNKFFYKNFIIKKFIKFLLSYSSKILVLSEKSKLELIKNFGINSNKISVYRFGVDFKYWSIDKKKELNFELPKEFILSVGNDMNRDYQIFDKINVNLPIIIVSQKKIFNVSNVSILNNIENEDLKYLYHKAYCVVIPIKKLLSESSGLSTVLQSMSSKKVTIVSDNDSLQEYFSDKKDVLFYEAENANSLQERIDQIIKNKELKKHIEINAQKTILEKYNLNNMEEQLIKFIN